MKISDINKLKSYFDEPKRIVFVAHKNPDGDAVGSTLALSTFYKKLGHHVQVVLPNSIPDFLMWMPNVGYVFQYDMHNGQSKNAIEQSDVIFLLDFNILSRVGDNMLKALETYQGDFIMIDHHQQPDDIAMVTYSDTSMCSTCEMVYHYMSLMGEQDIIDEDIATCLYTGIMTDTGSFRYPSTTSTTHKVIADLIEKGAKNSDIHNRVFSNNSYSRLQLLGKALTNLKVIPELNTAYITLSNKELDEYGYQKGDTEGIVNYALSLKGVVLGVIFIEDLEQRIIKISFRSKGKFSVNQFARNHFNGGGHDNAAGGRTELSLEETVTLFLSIISNYKNELAVSYEV